MGESLRSCRLCTCTECVQILHLLSFLWIKFALLRPKKLTFEGNFLPTATEKVNRHWRTSFCRRKADDFYGGARQIGSKFRGLQWEVPGIEFLPWWKYFILVEKQAGWGEETGKRSTRLSSVGSYGDASDKFSYLAQKKHRKKTGNLPLVLSMVDGNITYELLVPSLISWMWPVCQMLGDRFPVFKRHLACWLNRPSLF